MITNEQLTLIKERTEKATEGNWHVTLDDPYDRTYVLGAFNNVVTIIADIKGDADATFIAHAREDVPRLVAEVERLRDALETVLVKSYSTQTRHGGPSYDDVSDMTEYINEILDEVKANE